METLQLKTVKTNTSLLKKLDLVEELKGVQALKNQHIEIEALKAKYEKAKADLENPSFIKNVEFLTSKGLKVNNTEQRFVGEYEATYKAIVEKENSLSSSFFKILPDVIIDLANKYDMRFLPLSEYTGEIDLDLANKMREFEESSSEYNPNKTIYFILAPTEMFNKSYSVTKVVTHEVVVDPVVVAINPNNFIFNGGVNSNIETQVSEYINCLIDSSKSEFAVKKMYDILHNKNTKINFIHKWGDDFTVFRKTTTFLKKMFPQWYVIISLILGAITGYLNYFGEKQLSLYTVLALSLLSLLNIISFIYDYKDKTKIFLPKNKAKVNLEHRTVVKNR